MNHDVRRDQAHALAVLLDQDFASEWSAKPRLAVVRPHHDEDDIDHFEIDEPVSMTLGRLPRAECVSAAGVTALGHATSSTSRGSRVRVRVTVAVTCCDVFTIIRSAKSHHESKISDGALIVALREWAGLALCSCTKV